MEIKKKTESLQADWLARGGSNLHISEGLGWER